MAHPEAAAAVHLRTERLEIRPLTAGDVDAFVAYRRDPEVARFQSWDLDFDATEAHQLVAAQKSGVLSVGQWLQLGLRELPSGDLVGDVAIYPRPDKPDSYEIGVTLASAHQGRGLALEACRKVLDYLFADVGAHRVEATCDVRNKASSRLLRRLHMLHEARRVDADWCRGQWTSVDSYAVRADQRNNRSERSTATREDDGIESPRREWMESFEVGHSPIRGVSFLGLHTAAFAAMTELYGSVYGAPLIHQAPGAAWFAMGDGAEVHVYAAADEYHSFFGTAPVPGFFVDDFAGAQRRLTLAGVEWLTAPDTASGRIWRHYRGPDGNVYEVMGPDAGTGLDDGFRAR